MSESGQVPASAIILMKLALGFIDAAGGRTSTVARHLNAAIKIALDSSEEKPRPMVPASEGD